MNKNIKIIDSKTIEITTTPVVEKVDSMEYLSILKTRIQQLKDNQASYQPIIDEAQNEYDSVLSIAGKVDADVILLQ